MATATPNGYFILPDTTDNVSPDLYNQAFRNVETELVSLKKEHVIEQGKSGVWTYRKWSSGVAECWIDKYTIASVLCTAAWGPIHTGLVPSPGKYPFEFRSKTVPIVIVTWANCSTYSCPIWARANNSTTVCPQFQLIDPTRGEIKNVELAVYVKGWWR